jgi:hypothetical protein
VHEHQRGEKSSLGEVEQGPAAILHDVAISSVSLYVTCWITRGTERKGFKTYLSGEV